MRSNWLSWLAGTELPANPGWSGVYNSNDHQTVTAADAVALANALDRILPDIPHHDAVEHKLMVIIDVLLLGGSMARMRR